MAYMTIFEHRTIGLLEEIRDLLLKLTSQPPQRRPKQLRNRPKSPKEIKNPQKSPATLLTMRSHSPIRPRSRPRRLSRPHATIQNISGAPSPRSRPRAEALSCRCPVRSLLLRHRCHLLHETNPPDKCHRLEFPAVDGGGKVGHAEAGSDDR